MRELIRSGSGRPQNCPLAELDASSSDGDAASAAAISPQDPAEQQQPPPTHDTALSSVETSPTSSHRQLSEASTPPTTSKPSPSGSDTPLPSCASLQTIGGLPSAPSISATAFTSLLGALLTDQSAFVAKAAEAALVRFLCRLKDRPLPPPPLDNEPSVAEFTFGTTEPLAPPPQPLGDDADGAEAHHHARYELGAEARQILEDEIVCGIVLGLARLDQEDSDASAAGQDDLGADADSGATTSTPAKPAAAPAREGSADKEDEAVNPTLFLSPEEEPLDEEWLAGLGSFGSSAEAASSSCDDAGDAGVHTLDYAGWGAPLPQAGAHGGVSGTEGIVPADKDPEPGDLSFHPPSPPMDPMGYSSFSPDLGGGADEEASIGKMVAMSLVGAIATAECLDADVFVDQFLPEVARLKDDGMFYVRKEAVQALGALAKCLSSEAVEETAVRPTFSSPSRRRSTR